MFATAIQPDTVKTTVEHELLLARLAVPSKRSPTVNAVRKDLGKSLGHEPSTEAIQDWIDQLRASGLIGERLTLTDSGRQQALRFLGVDALPARTTWATIVPRYLVPLALGVDPADAAAVKRISREEGLACRLLKRQQGIARSEKESLDSLLEAIVCKKLGYDAATLKELKQQVLSEILQATDGKIPKTPKQQVRAMLGANNLAQLRAKTLAAWIGKASGRAKAQASPPSIEEFDLDEFSRTVLAAARHCPTGWFGDNKVFISHIYRHLQGEPAFRGMSLDQFKRRLVEANQTDRLELSRADLVAVMDPIDVRESETFQLGASFHFVFVGKERP